MKKIRYNDRLWFGKYKGMRVYEIISSDMSYFRKLIDTEKICFDEKLTNKLNKKKSSRIFGYDVPDPYPYNPDTEQRIIEAGTEVIRRVTALAGEPQTYGTDAEATLTTILERGIDDDFII